MNIFRRLFPQGSKAGISGSMPSSLGGAWIFLSHSHRDYYKVRQLRNELETMGHHPLMFFLKCMGDNSELDDLIRREIEAREWFLLCESEHSRVSRWVQREVEIITSRSKNVFAKVDLAGTAESQLNTLRALAKRATVFISYHHADLAIATEIARVLRTHDFSVLDGHIDPGETIDRAVRLRIKEAADDGFVLILLSAKSLASEWVRFEIREAIRLQAFGTGGISNVIPVLIEDVRIPIELADIQAFDLSKGAIQEDVERMVGYLKTRAMA